jgi:hypothetical protein
MNRNNSILAIDPAKKTGEWLLVAVLLALALGSALCHGQSQGTASAPVSTDYSIVQRGPHSRVWQRTVLVTNPAGFVRTNIQSYKETVQH